MMLNQEQIDAMKKTLERGIEVVAVPQLFETPNHLAERMVDEAGLRPSDYVLEPSAGTGVLVGAIIEAGLTWDRIAIVEKNHNLCSMLADKYRRVYPGDFLERGSWELGGKFDKILMNPPFENGADIKHIMHALSMLKPGGRLVAICANGPRQNEKLKPLANESGGYWEELPQRTFKNKGTNVNTSLLIIDG